MEDAGAQWIRARILWNVAEPQDTNPPTYNWHYVDSVITPLVARGFTPIVGIYSNPAWAATTQCGPVNRVPVSRFGLFVEHLAERFDGDHVDDAPGSPIVRHWEVSNEPDFNVSRAGGEADNGSCFGGNPSALGEHLRAAYFGAKAASPLTTVVFGGPAYDRFYNKTGYSPAGPFDYNMVRDTIDYLDMNYGGRAGWPYYDWMALHIYNDFRNNWDGSQPFNQELLGKVAHFRANQLVWPGKWDVRTMPLALTEASLPSMPGDQFTNRSEAIQAAYPGQLYSRSAAANVKAVVWYSVEDNSRGSCSNIYDWLTFGLLRSLPMYNAAQNCPTNPIPDYHVNQDHEGKPAHSAFAAAKGAIGGATYAGQIGPSQTGRVTIEAYRFFKTGRGYVAAVFTDNGERLGRVGFLPVTANMTFNATILPDWTGNVLVTDHLGGVTRYENVGSSLVLTVGQAPIYVEAE